MGFITENNWPNMKVAAMGLVGSLISVYLILAPFFNLPTIDKDIIMQHADNILGYASLLLTSILAFVAYMKKPGKGDGIKEAPK